MGRKGSHRDPPLTRRGQQTDPTPKVRQSDQTEPEANQQSPEAQQPPRKRRNPELSRRGTALRALHSPAHDPDKNAIIGFRITRTLHARTRLLAAQRRVKLSTVLIEALEYLLELRGKQEISYFAPPMGELGIRTSMWISQTLNRKLEELIKRDQRAPSVILESATIAYLDAQSA